MKTLIVHLLVNVVKTNGAAYMNSLFLQHMLSLVLFSKDRSLKTPRTVRPDEYAEQNYKTVNKSVIPCQIDIYVLGPYLFTLNIPNSFEKIIQKDQILLSATSRALATLQVAFGTFPYILSLGADSNEAAELIIGKRSGWFCKRKFWSADGPFSPWTPYPCNTGETTERIRRN